VGSDKDVQDTENYKITLDIINNILKCPGKSVDMGAYLTKKILDLASACCVILVQYNGTSSIRYQIISANPIERCQWADSLNLSVFFNVSDKTLDTQLIRADNSSEAGRILQQEGFNSSLVVTGNITS
jgi:hypothetical protein